MVLAIKGVFWAWFFGTFVLFGEFLWVLNLLVVSKNNGERYAKEYMDNCYEIELNIGKDMNTNRRTVIMQYFARGRAALGVYQKIFCSPTDGKYYTIMVLRRNKNSY